MCDYSLQNVRSRPAKVGDKLTTRDFGTCTRGFAAAEDAGAAVCCTAPVAHWVIERGRDFRSWHKADAHILRRSKADMTFCGSPLLRSLLGVKRTWAVAPHMSAFDPKRTFIMPLSRPFPQEALRVGRSATEPDHRQSSVPHTAPAEVPRTA